MTIQQMEKEESMAIKFTRQDLEDWFHSNYPILRDRTEGEIAELAIVCGFNRHMVANARLAGAFKEAA